MDGSWGLGLLDRLARRAKGSTASGGDFRSAVDFAPRHDDGGGEIAGDVERRPAHVEKAVDAKHEADPFGRHADHADDEREHRSRTGRNAGRPDPAQYADDQTHELLRSEERRVGKEFIRTCRSRWSSDN